MTDAVRPSTCDICDGRLMWTDAPTSHPDPDWYPCPRCLSVPPTQGIRDVAHGSHFYPWEAPGGNYVTGRAWWEPDEQVPLWLPMGLAIGLQFLAQHYGDKHRGPWCWWNRRRPMVQPNRYDWALTRPGEHRTGFAVVVWDGHGERERHHSIRLVVAPKLADLPDAHGLPPQIRRTAAVSICIRHALGLGAL